MRVGLEEGFSIPASTIISHRKVGKMEQCSGGIGYGVQG